MKFSGVTYLGGSGPIREAWIPNTHELFHALCCSSIVSQRNSKDFSSGVKRSFKFINDIMSDQRWRLI